MNEKKNKFNKKVLVLLGGVILVIIILILVVKLIFGGASGNSVFEQTDAEKFENDYEKLNNKVISGEDKYPVVKISSDNIVKYSTVEEVLDIFSNSGDGVVYFGYSSCLYCRNAVQVLLDTAEDTKLDVIHYIDVEQLWKEELDSKNETVVIDDADSKYTELLTLLGDELVTDYVLTDDSGKEVKTDSKKIEVPLVIFITNGQISGYNIGTLFSQENPLVEMDDDQKRGLGEIYGYGIRDVVDSKTNKGLLSK